MGRKSISSELQDQIIECAELGMTAKEISTKLLISYQIVIRYTQGIKMRHESSLPLEAHDKITALREKGLTLKNIATELGISIQTVHRHISKQYADENKKEKPEQKQKYIRPPATYSNKQYT